MNFFFKQRCQCFDFECENMIQMSPNALLIFPKHFIEIPLQISFKLDKITLADASDIELHCSFVVMDTRHKTIAMVSGDRIICPLPERTKLPSLPVGKGIHLTAFNVYSNICMYFMQHHFSVSLEMLIFIIIISVRKCIQDL